MIMDSQKFLGLPILSLGNRAHPKLIGVTIEVNVSIDQHLHGKLEEQTICESTYCYASCQLNASLTKIEMKNTKALSCILSVKDSSVRLWKCMRYS